ncbi:MAG: thermonuclease family protein [Calothrix sp. C42_A2020_038]|nr:thermonuclease family protein [Calothrix sp. C42_A2020_038]
MELVELLLILGTVVGFIDGNTIRIQDNTGQSVTVKLACIALPQANKYQVSATQKLKQILGPGSSVVVKSVERLPDGRVVGEVFLDNKSVNLKMVESGNAIVERETLESCNDETKFLIAEATAQNKRLGLWNQSKIHSLRGKLIYEEIPPVRSVRAYQGEEFFLMTNSGSEKRLVLRPSQRISRVVLQAFHNQLVEIKAVHTEGTRPSPQTNSACPRDINGLCKPQGYGYQVLYIVPLTQK